MLTAYSKIQLVVLKLKRLNPEDFAFAICLVVAVPFNQFQVQ